MNSKEDIRFKAFMFVIMIILIAVAINYYMGITFESPFWGTLTVLARFDIVAVIVIFIYELSSVIAVIIGLMVLALPLILTPVGHLVLLLILLIVISIVKESNIKLDDFLDDEQRMVIDYIVKSITILNIVGGICVFAAISNPNTYVNKQQITDNIEQEVSQDNEEKAVNEKKSEEERRNAEIERNRQNAEENKKKMEEQMKAAKFVAEKTKMDLLIPIAKEYKWTEADVRNAVQVLENCGVSFDKLSNIKKDDNVVGSKVFTCDIKNTLYDRPPSLCIMAQGNHIDRIFVEVHSNCNINYFLDKRIHRKEPFNHSYSNGFMLYMKDGNKDLSRNAFNEIVFDQNKINRLNNQVSDYVKSKNAISTDKKQLSIVVQVETNNYNNPVLPPASEYMNSKIIWLGTFDYNVKSETYGKDYDKYHAEILIDGDNVIEIYNKEVS